MNTRPIPRNSRPTNDGVSERGSARLTFSILDGLAFAARKGRLGQTRSTSFVVGDIGPLLELVQLSDHGGLPPLNKLPVATASENSGFCSALQAGRSFWLCPVNKQMGFFRTTNCEADVSNSYQFGVAAKSAALAAGFSRKIASQLVAAAVEMIDNVYLQSAASPTGLAAFYARPGGFEFVISDRGIGILRSLQQNSEYAQLSDCGDALQLALTDGCSRFGSNSNHGHGFRPLFIGLSNLNGSLRFRSGDHALTIDGRNPQSIPWTKIAKPAISGFLASVLCRVSSRS